MPEAQPTSHSMSGLEDVLSGLLKVLAADILVLDSDGTVRDTMAGMDEQGHPLNLFPLPAAPGKEDGPGPAFPFLEALERADGDWPPLGRNAEERELLAARIRDGLSMLLYGEGEHFAMEYPMLDADGTTVWRQCRAAPLFSDSGEVRGAVVTILDMTDLKEAQEGLREQRNLFRSILGSMPDGIVLKDTGLRYVAVNPAFAKLLGRSERELLGSDDRQWFDPDTADQLEEADGRVLETGSSHYLDVSLKGMDKVRWLQVAKTMVTDDYGEPMGLICAIRDISNRRLMERELESARDGAEKATQAKSRFLATMSHEIRTPLVNIAGLTDVVLEGDLNAEQRRHMELLKGSADHLLTLLGDILDFSAIEAGKMAIRPKPFRLRKLVDLVERSFSGQAEDKGLELQVHVDADLPPRIRGDQSRIRQILFNLLSNAVKYTRAGSVVLRVLSGEADDGMFRAENGREILFQVEDTGIGIEEEDQERMFEEYSRSYEAQTGGYKGIGLGLAISHRLAQLMGGVIEMQSTPGRGSSFVFRARFPGVDDEDGAEGDIPGGPDSSGEAQGSGEAKGREDGTGADGPSEEARRLRILLVDDNTVNRLLARRLLENMGHVVREGRNGQEALAMLGSEPCDVVFMDVQMPVMDGLTAVRRIREHTSGKFDPDVPVVALTAHALDGDRERFLAAGMDGYLAKPLDRKALESILMGLSTSPGRDFRERNTQGARTPRHTRNMITMTDILDSSATLRRLHGDEEFLKVLYAAFLEDLDERERLIVQAVADVQFEDTLARAHSLKGAAKTIDAHGVSQCALDLERAAAEQDEGAMVASLDRLREELARVRQAMAVFK